jgi:hypothetical protein
MQWFALKKLPFSFFFPRIDLGMNFSKMFEVKKIKAW